MTKIEEQKLTLANHNKNPLRDRLRKMTNDQLVAEMNNAFQAFQAKDTKPNFNYYMFLSYLCEARGVIKPTPGINA